MVYLYVLVYESDFFLEFFFYFFFTIFTKNLFLNIDNQLFTNNLSLVNLK